MGYYVFTYVGTYYDVRSSSYVVHTIFTVFGDCRHTWLLPPSLDDHIIIIVHQDHGAFPMTIK
jgi:hypothetical protein